jgi:hypothetical protein
LRSFLFTMKNSHKFPARKLPLKAEEKLQAIICDFECGPDFWNIRVSDNCNENSKSDSYLDSAVNLLQQDRIGFCLRLERNPISGD